MKEMQTTTDSRKKKQEHSQNNLKLKTIFRRFSH